MYEGKEKYRRKVSYKQIQNKSNISNEDEEE